jgi:hypothetical protein
MEEGDVFKLTVRYEKEEVRRNTEKINIAFDIKHADKILELIQETPKIIIPEMAQRKMVNG